VYGVSELMISRVAGSGLLEYYRIEAEKIEGKPYVPAPLPVPKTATSQLWRPAARPAVEETVTLRAPDGNDCNWLVTQSGRAIMVRSDRLVTVSREDSIALKMAGWTKVEPVAAAP
jgi:hypothetical protein